MVAVSGQGRASAKKLARTLRLLASPVRLLILRSLGARGAYVGDLAKMLRMSQSATSHQLGILAQAGIVAAKKEGRSVRYTLATTGEAKQISRLLRSFGA
jgi:DNA-binding transcriptional ArsR family regulator